MHLRKAKSNTIIALSSCLFILSTTSVSAYQEDEKAIIHTMVKGDTLWSLSKIYFNDPYIWAKITELDGNPVPDVYRIPTGHKVLVRPEIKANPQIKNTNGKVATNIAARKVNKEKVNKKNDKKVTLSTVAKVNPFVTPKNSLVKKHVEKVHRNQYLFLTKSDGLIRAFWEGKYVTIPVKTIVEHVKKTIPDVDESALSSGVYIDKTLIKQLLGIKK